MRVLRGLPLLALLVALPAWGAHPNVAPEFQADKVYQFNGLDNVNLYNGNLTLTIPIGQQYGGNGTLSYGLVLSYNSKAWKQEIPTYHTGCLGNPTDDPNCFKPYIKTMPSRRSNAGMGWLVSLGRLIAPGDPVVDVGNIVAGPAGWVYESPDGADHVFVMQDASSPATFQYTKDGSYLRLRHLSGGKHAVDLPDGTIHTFGDYGAYSPRLEEIRDPFGSSVHVEYAANGDWTLNELAAGGSVPIRQHYVRFKDLTVEPNPPANAPPNYNFAVDEIELAAFNGQRAKYSFVYTIDTIPYGCFGDVRPGETPNPTVPRLQRVKLPDLLPGLPDPSSWEFEYYTGGYCSSLRTVTLPTKGKLEWTYASWEMPTTKCRADIVPNMPDGSAAPFQYSEGVRTKTVTLPGSAAATWTYGQGPELLSGYLQVCLNPNGLPLTGRKHQQSRVTVDAPDGSRSEHLFSVWPYLRMPGVSDFSDSEYGLAYTRAVGANGAACSYLDPAALCLSSRQYVRNASGTLEVSRSTYARYEGETRSVSESDEQYRREAESRTVFHDDGNRYVQTKKSNYDGLGHYRTVTTWSSCSTGTCAAPDTWSRSTTEQTNYNPLKPQVTIDPVEWTNSPVNNRPGTAEKWFLSLFDTKSTTQGGETLSGEFAFDSATGFLRRQRTHKLFGAGVAHANDLVAVFESDALGNVASELYYGGDRQNLGTGSLASAVGSLQPEYVITHGYQYGRRNYSAYMSSSGAAGSEVLRLLSATIDQNTGLVKSTLDPANVETTYDYDASGRILSVAPMGMAKVTYAYPPMTATSVPKVIEKSLTSADVVLTTNEYEYDGLGRLSRTRTLMPSTSSSEQWSTVDMKYDLLGRKDSVAEAYILGVDVPHWTIFEYDLLGRTKRVQAPDGTASLFEYLGSREKRRMSEVQTPSGPADVTVVERYDGLGRLVTVQESSGPANGAVTTGYRYDVGGRLIEVEMRGSEPSQPVQWRTFVYDGLGFLREEKHPEMDRIFYHEYDSRGHARLKVLENPLLQPRTITPHDLRFTFDRAERLRLVETQHPTAQVESFMNLKEYTYGTENLSVPGGTNRTKGKLVTAARWNYAFPPMDPAEDVYKVTETYGYNDASGRKTDRSTKLEHGDPWGYTVIREVNQSVVYNDLSLPATIRYPSCARCTYPATSEVTAGYSQGRLVRVDRKDDANVVRNIASELTYWPGGMTKSVLHGNSMTDSIDADVMSRPKQIRFQPWQVCTRPSSVSISASSTGINPGDSVTLTASASGTTPFTYQWFSRVGSGTWQEVAAPQGQMVTLTVILTSTTSYLVQVRNACNFGESGTFGNNVASALATITVSACEAPRVETQPIGQEVAAGSAVSLSVAATGTAPLTYAWHVVGNSSTVIGAGSTLSIPSVAQTTSYACRISNSCGEVTSATATVTVVLAPPTNLFASRTGAGSVGLTWGASAGAHHYNVERMSNGSAFAVAGTPNGTSFSDTGLVAGRTYVYRVVAVDMGGGSASTPSNRDLATTMTFSNVVSGTVIDDAHFHELLTALNALQAAAGLPVLSWTTILPPGAAGPAAGVSVRAAELTALRTRMSTSLQALGVGSVPYVDDPIQVGQTPIRAAHITALQQRAQ